MVEYRLVNEAFKLEGTLREDWGLLNSHGKMKTLCGRGLLHEVFKSLEFFFATIYYTI
jgi:hypothetical protein